MKAFKELSNPDGVVALVDLDDKSYGYGRNPFGVVSPLADSLLFTSIRTKEREAMLPLFCEAIQGPRGNSECLRSSLIRSHLLTIVNRI